MGWSMTPSTSSLRSETKPKRPRPPPPSGCWPWWPAKTSSKLDDGTWKIAKNVAPDRVISTVDPEARHRHKSRSEYRDGYKAHLAIEPETGW